MDKKEVNRVKKAVWRRFGKDEIVYVCGVNPKVVFSPQVQKFVESLQIVMIDDVSSLLREKPMQTSLLLVGNYMGSHSEVASMGKQMGLKVEHHDAEGIKLVLEEALVDNCLVVEGERDTLDNTPLPDKPLAEPMSQPEQLEEEGGEMIEQQPMERGSAGLPAEAAESGDSAPEADDSVAQSDNDELTPLQEFARKFLAHPAAGSSDGVGSRDTNQLILDVDGLGQNARQLESLGWLESVTRPGKSKVGGYRPTDKLREEAGRALLANTSDNPYVRAKWLVENRPALEQRKAQLEAEIVEIENRLEQADRAKAWLEQGQEF